MSFPFAKLPRYIRGKILFNNLSFHYIKQCVLTSNVFNVLNKRQKATLLTISKWFKSNCCGIYAKPAAQAFTVACSTHDWVIARRLYKNYEFYIEDFDLRIFRIAVRSGDIKMVEFIYDLLGNRVMNLFNVSITFRLACARGHFHIVKWIHKRIVINNIEANISFTIVGKQNYYKIMQLIATNFKINTASWRAYRKSHKTIGQRNYRL